MTCPNCNDDFWVCENHDDKPWGDGLACCGGAGMPCPVCNVCDENTPPKDPPGFTTIWDIHRGWIS